MTGMKSVKPVPQKILFMTGLVELTGGQIVFADLARSLQSLGFDVDFIGFKGVGTLVPKHIYRDLNGSFIDLPISADAAVAHSLLVNTARKMLAKRIPDYDRVLLDSWHIGLAALLTNCDLAQTYQLTQDLPTFDIVVDNAASWSGKLYTLLPRVAMQRIIVSRATAQAYEAQYGQRYPYIRLYLDDTYHKKPFEVHNRSPLRFISSASYFDLPRKGLDFLIESLKDIKTPFTLTLVCGQPLKRKLERLPFPVTIVSASTPAEMSALLSEHDVYINTSTLETFGLALAEAVAVGIPSIALDSVGNREYSRDDNFIFVKDKKIFTSELERLCSLAQRKQLSDRGKQSMADFTLDKTVSQLRKIINM
jgi:glycosyltransferase involved in cell wall biosynthesis